MAIVWDPFDPRTCEDPDPVYARLRAQDPWHRTTWGTLAISRFEDCLQALHDPRLGNDPRGSDEHRLLLAQPLIAGAAEDLELAGFMFRDPPEHTCRRATVARSFTPAAVDGWTDRLTAIIEELCDQIVRRGRVDVVNELTPALQTAVMGAILGLSPKGMGQLRDWRLASLLAKDAAMAHAGASHPQPSRAGSAPGRRATAPPTGSGAAGLPTARRNTAMTSEFTSGYTGQTENNSWSDGPLTLSKPTYTVHEAYEFERPSGGPVVPTPVAVAQITLSHEERVRIAKELGLDESQLDAVPLKLDIARYDVEDGDLDDDEDEVSGFAFNPGAMSFNLQKFGVADQFQAGLKIGRIPGGILIPV